MLTTAKKKKKTPFRGRVPQTEGVYEQRRKRPGQPSSSSFLLSLVVGVLTVLLSSFLFLLLPFPPRVCPCVSGEAKRQQRGARTGRERAREIGRHREWKKKKKRRRGKRLIEKTDEGRSQRVGEKENVPVCKQKKTRCWQCCW